MLNELSVACTLAHLRTSAQLCASRRLGGYKTTPCTHGNPSHSSSFTRQLPSSLPRSSYFLTLLILPPHVLFILVFSYSSPSLDHWLLNLSTSGHQNAATT